MSLPEVFAEPEFAESLAARTVWPAEDAEYDADQIAANPVVGGVVVDLDATAQVAGDQVAQAACEVNAHRATPRDGCPDRDTGYVVELDAVEHVSERKKLSAALVPRWHLTCRYRSNCPR